jgi:hypothetical protein
MGLPSVSAHCTPLICGQSGVTAGEPPTELPPPLAALPPVAPAPPVALPPLEVPALPPAGPPEPPALALPPDGALPPAPEELPPVAEPPGDCPPLPERTSPPTAEPLPPAEAGSPPLPLPSAVGSESAQPPSPRPPSPRDKGSSSGASRRVVPHQPSRKRSKGQEPGGAWEAGNRETKESVIGRVRSTTRTPRLRGKRKMTALSPFVRLRAGKNVAVDSNVLPKVSLRAPTPASWRAPFPTPALAAPFPEGGWKPVLDGWWRLQTDTPRFQAPTEIF